jgi:hypothetical protein
MTSSMNMENYTEQVQGSEVTTNNLPHVVAGVEASSNAAKLKTSILESGLKSMFEGSGKVSSNVKIWFTATVYFARIVLACYVIVSNWMNKPVRDPSQPYNLSTLTLYWFEFVALLVIMAQFVFCLLATKLFKDGSIPFFSKRDLPQFMICYLFVQNMLGISTFYLVRFFSPSAAMSRFKTVRTTQNLMPSDMENAVADTGKRSSVIHIPEAAQQQEEDSCCISTVRITVIAIIGILFVVIVLPLMLVACTWFCFAGLVAALLYCLRCHDAECGEILKWIFGGWIVVVELISYPFCLGLALVAVYIKVSQLHFLATDYFTQWSYLQWISFLGFVNNIASIDRYDDGVKFGLVKLFLDGCEDIQQHIRLPTIAYTYFHTDLKYSSLKAFFAVLGLSNDDFCDIILLGRGKTLNSDQGLQVERSPHSSLPPAPTTQNHQVETVPKSIDSNESMPNAF